MFKDRKDAGRKLAEKLGKFKDRKATIVLAIPRGGVIVGEEIAAKLNIPLSIIYVKKLSAPFNPELAVGAVGQNGATFIDWELINKLNITESYIKNEKKKKFKQVEERIEKYGTDINELAEYSHFILTDDGVATGATTKAAIKVIRSLQLPGKNQANIILAVPVISKKMLDEFNEQTEETAVMEVPEDFGAVGQFYIKFDQVSDNQVINIIKKYRRHS